MSIHTDAHINQRYNVPAYTRPYTRRHIIGICASTRGRTYDYSPVDGYIKTYERPSYIYTYVYISQYGFDRATYKGKYIYSDSQIENNFRFHRLIKWGD